MADLLHSATQRDTNPADSTLHPNASERRNSSRSPHPYHRRGASLLKAEIEGDGQGQGQDQFDRPSTTNQSSDSGTEADDERGRFLKGLPAPPLRPHKGLRGASFEDPTPHATPLDTPSPVENDEKQFSAKIGGKNDSWVIAGVTELHALRAKYIKRRRLELVRRIIETILFFSIGLLVTFDHLSEGTLLPYIPVIYCYFAIAILLYLLYPIRAAYKAKSAGYSLRSSLSRGYHIPARFDPAPLIYPVFLPLLVSTSLLAASHDFILPNVVAGISSLPPRTVPLSSAPLGLNYLHWVLTLLPLAFSNVTVRSGFETLTLLYPLHLYTVRTIEFLTTTSLDPAEQQLLATALVDLYLFAESAQIEILKALLWLGTLLLFIICWKPLQWELALARIPSWRLRVNNRRSRSGNSILQFLDRKVCGLLVQLDTSYKSKQTSDSEDGEDEDVVELTRKSSRAPSVLSTTIRGLVKHPTANILDQIPALQREPRQGRSSDSFDRKLPEGDVTSRRRHTLSVIDQSQTHNHRTTPSGRPKRCATTSSQPLLALTPAQVAVRKWAFAAFVYAAVLFIILGPIRIYISVFSLEGHEPFGWAIGYLFGDISEFRSWVRSTDLDTWIPLPEPFSLVSLNQRGWVESLRQDSLGPANMRLLICAYCLAILLIGITTVLNLSSVVEVDTRRKVFHGMMVAMLLPTVFIDPCFTSLALILILAIFLLLDLFRASQLPPISRPLTTFLAPYVDGRDYRGPIIVSHIFLLIGCAIPLWLSMAAIPRTGEGPWTGWDARVRDVSMISGVVCVGMGDSAASLIGRRYGRHKWYWGGGKSLEGSLAFAIAVTLGLLMAYAWLRVGGWVLSDGQSLFLVLAKAWLAASGASLTEAVLTGANDNVVVPVMLWLLVRGLRL